MLTYTIYRLYMNCRVFCSTTDLNRIWKQCLKFKTIFFIDKCYKFSRKYLHFESTYQNLVLALFHNT